MYSQLRIHGVGASLPPVDISQMHMTVRHFRVLEHGSHPESIHAVARDEQEHENKETDAACYQCEQTPSQHEFDRVYDTLLAGHGPANADGVEHIAESV